MLRPRVKYRRGGNRLGDVNQHCGYSSSRDKTETDPTGQTLSEDPSVTCRRRPVDGLGPEVLSSLLRVSARYYRPTSSSVSPTQSNFGFRGRRAGKGPTHDTPDLRGRDFESKDRDFTHSVTVGGGKEVMVFLVSTTGRSIRALQRRAVVGGNSEQSRVATEEDFQEDDDCVVHVPL